MWLEQKKPHNTQTGRNPLRSRDSAVWEAPHTGQQFNINGRPSARHIIPLLVRLNLTATAGHKQAPWTPFAASDEYFTDSSLAEHVHSSFHKRISFLAAHFVNPIDEVERI